MKPTTLSAAHIGDTSTSPDGTTLPSEHPPVPARKLGVLLVNLGTPDEPTAPAVKSYLREFLSDTRIVDLPRAIWLPILHGVILNVRPRMTAKAYASIWRSNPSESPLRYFTRRQAEDLSTRLASENIIVDWAMRYGSPAVSDRLEALQAQGCDRIFIAPLYPQYSATTTGSVYDAVFDAMRNLRWQPAVRMAPAFHDAPDYITALAAVTRRRIQSLDFDPEAVIISFHGLPERYFKSGDPYHCHCQKTARLLREEMGWSEDFAPIAFQSKFGREKWLEPATTDIIDALAADGVKKLCVVTPGFTSDCIETLEEIGIAAREQFEEAGGQNFDAIPCLNDEPEMIDFLVRFTRTELSGWLEEEISEPALNKRYA
ncbi:MAG: ferrochelatase [Pseudomonadota bacterium]